MSTKSSLISVVKTLSLALVALVLSAGLNITVIRYVWSDTSMGVNLWEVNVWIMQSILPCVVYRFVVVCGKNADITPFRLCIAVLTPLSSLLCMDLYRVYAYHLNFGRGYVALKGFVPHLFRMTSYMVETLAKDFADSWWTVSLYVVTIIFSVIVHHPTEVQNFFHQLYKKLSAKK